MWYVDFPCLHWHRPTLDLSARGSAWVFWGAHKIWMIFLVQFGLWYNWIFISMQFYGFCNDSEIAIKSSIKRALTAPSPIDSQHAFYEISFLLYNFSSFILRRINFILWTTEICFFFGEEYRIIIIMMINIGKGSNLRGNVSIRGGGGGNIQSK